MLDTPKKRPRRRGPAHDREVIERAKEMKRYGLSYQTIASSLKIPRSTVQYWTQDITADASGPWTLVEAARATTPDPAIVMAHLGVIISASHGRVSGLTRDEAQWVTMLTHILPGLYATAPSVLWHLARQFIEALARDDKAEVLRLEGLVAQDIADARWPDLRHGGES